MEVSARQRALAEVKQRLDSAGIVWAVAAGTAVYLYAGNRPPTDVDILVQPRELDAAAAALGAVAHREEMPWGEVQKVDLDEIEVAGLLLLRNGGTVYRYCLDDEMVRHLQSASLEGIELSILAPEDLAALKLVLQRGPEQGKHDLEDVAALVSKVQIDPGYLRWRLGEMGAMGMAKPLLERWGWD